MSDSVLLWITEQDDRKDPRLHPFLDAVAREVDLQVLGEGDLSNYLDGGGDERVIGAILAPSIQAPVTAARLFLRRLPEREVIFISDPDEGDTGKRDANLAFLYGHHRTLNAGDPEEGVRTIRRLLEQARRQRRFRWALARMNKQIDESRDVTVHQERLAISDRLLASILAQSPDALFALDLDGFVLAANRAAVKSYDLGETEGSHFDGTDLAKKLPQLKDLVAAASQHRETRRQEMTLPQMGGSDAESVSLEASASPVFQENDHLVGITVLLRDVTSLKRAERRLRELNEALEERVEQRTEELKVANQRLEGFLYSLAHDLRTPVRAIAGFSQLLREEHGSELNEEGKDFVRRISEATRRMDGLIGDLLSYSRVAKMDLPLRAVAIGDVLHTARTAVAPQVEKTGAEITIEITPGSVIAHGNTLEQVIINLFSNALHYARPDVPPRVRVRNEWRDGRCRLWIEDNGIGIDPAYQEKIFGIFERLAISSNPSGTGIGLAIVKGGVERMGGTVGIESEPGKGSSFWIELPAAPGD